MLKAAFPLDGFCRRLSSRWLNVYWWSLLLVMKLFFSVTLFTHPRSASFPAAVSPANALSTRHVKGSPSSLPKFHFRQTLKTGDINLLQCAPVKRVSDMKHFLMRSQSRELARCHRCLRPRLNGSCSPVWSQAWLMNPLADNCDGKTWQLISPRRGIKLHLQLHTWQEGMALAAQDNSVTRCEGNTGLFIRLLGWWVNWIGGQVKRALSESKVSGENTVWVAQFL